MKRRYKVGIIPGDGIGREVIGAASTVLEAVNDIAREFSLDFVRMETGAGATQKYGNVFPQETIEGMKQTRAVLFGAAGEPNGAQVVQGMRRTFELYANVRPIKAFPGIRVMHPEADFIIVRENTEGLYRREGYVEGDKYVNLRVFTKKGMERIVRFCFNFAQKEGRKKVTFTHKAGLLTFTDQPLKEMFYEIAKEFPAVEAVDMEVDNCAMRIVMKPEQLSVVLAENANGDILSDVGAGIVGGLGLVAAANIGDSMAVFEPIHGSAPKHAGKNIVNPIAAIMAAKMMIHYLGESEMALKMEQAVKEVLLEGKVRTYDLGGTSSTMEVGQAIAKSLCRIG